MGTLENYASPLIPKDNEPCLCGKNKSFIRCCASKKKQRPPPHGVLIKKRFLPADICNKIISGAEQTRGVDMPVSQLSDDDTISQLGLERNAQAVDMAARKAWVTDMVRSLLLNTAPKSFGLDISSFEAPILMRYEPGGYYREHSDCETYYQQSQSWVKEINRDVSLLLYLNQDYEGGALRFSYFNYNFQPKQGDLLMFPSDHRYMHEAQTVSRGVRYVIVSWASASA